MVKRFLALNIPLQIKSEFPIQNIQWMSVYVHNRQVVHSQDMQIELENTLLPGKTLTINLQIPFAQIDEKYRSIFYEYARTYSCL